MSTFWDRQAEKFDRDARQHGDLYDQTIERTRSFLSPSDTVLDFGCATGEYGAGIAPYVRHVHGIDLSAQMIELANNNARERKLENVRFDQMDLFDARLAAGSFSAVVAFNIFHLVPDGQSTLARVNALLADGGLLISQTPCLRERPLLYNVVINPAQRLGLVPKILKLGVAELETLIAANGFEILESMIWHERAVQWIAARKR